MPTTWEKRAGSTLRPGQQTSSKPRRRSTGSRQALRDLQIRARRLAATEIAYVAHPRFVGLGAEEWLAAQRPDSLDQLPATQTSDASEGLAFVTGLVRDRLLTPQEESYLFLRMNYCKHRAEILRRRLKPNQPDPALVDRIEKLLQESLDCRDRIVTANLRLVVAVATKLSDSLDRLSELVSEGLVPLIRAVELFDVSRGHRFSTYATWAVRNQMLRSLKRHRQQQQRLLPLDTEFWDDVPETRTPANTDEQRSNVQRRYVAQLLKTLNERERLVISARFGLNGHPTGQSLAEIASLLKLSKERVRQIILQTLTKLRLAADPQWLEECDWASE